MHICTSIEPSILVFIYVGIATATALQFCNVQHTHTSEKQISQIVVTGIERLLL